MEQIFISEKKMVTWIFTCKPNDNMNCITMESKMNTPILLGFYKIGMLTAQ